MIIYTVMSKGSIHHLQCLDEPNHEVWSADHYSPDIDVDNCNLVNGSPRCIHCSGIARPNILMFNDFKWESGRYKHQKEALGKWLGHAENVSIIELGAGQDITTVRDYGEMLGWPITRINPRDSQLGAIRGISLPMGVLDG